MKTYNKNRSFGFSLFCVLFGIWMAISPTLKVVATYQEPVVYIADIRIWTGDDSPENAKKYFDSIGYTFVNTDINAGTDSDERVFIGYKTTDNADEALTDIRLLPMDTGYQLYSYNEINDYLVSQNQGTAKKMAQVAATFADYYDEGSPKAKEAYEGLNLFDLGDDEKTLLGDYILENRDDLQAFFVKMIINSNPTVIGSVMNMLSVGITPYQNDYDPETKEFYTSNWAERVTTSAIWEQLEEGLTADEESALDRAYNDGAKILFRELQDFAMLYENAKARYNERELKNTEFKSFESAVENMDNITAEDADVIYIAAYDALSAYELREGLTLADWLISVGKLTEATFDLRELYPVVESLGEAQMDMVGLTNFISAVNCLNEGSSSDDYEDALEGAHKAIEKFNGTQSMSIWENAESDMKDKYYAYTSEAVRKSSAENVLGKKTYLEGLTEDFKNAMGWIKLAVGIATTLISAADLILKLCVSCAWISVAASACAMKILGWLSFAGFILTGVLMLVELGYSIFCWFYELIFDLDRTLGHTEKPAYIFDSVEKPGGAITVRYKSALDDKGNIGDINAGMQYKWCILAYTNDKNVGSPLVLDDTGQVFKAIYGNSSKQNGYDHIRYFGERNVANTNAYCEYDYKNGCYLHFRTLSSIEGAAPESETEQETVDTKTSSYIGAVMISVAANVEQAKAKIVRHEGKYYTYDYNLSPDMGFATYIGYSITDDPSRAVTDIRVAPYAGSSDGTAVVMIGDIAYTRADIIGTYVSNSDEQTKPQADALYYTTDPNAGSPITADGLHFVTDFKDVEAGWEPVSFFCADLPYDFNTSYNTVNKKTIDAYSGYSLFSSKKLRYVYMYFEPSEKYVGGEQYLSGFYFIGGYDLCSDPDYSNEKILSFKTLKDRIAAMPNTKICSIMFNNSIRDGAYNAKATGEIQEYLVYTYTYNPKRAITDAMLYQGLTYSDMLPYNLTKPSGSGVNLGYTACSYIGQQLYEMYEFVKGSINQYGAVFIHKGNTFVDSAAMNILQERADLVRDYGYIRKYSGNIEYGYNCSDFLPEGLYVARHAGDKEPLRLDDVVICGAQYDAKTDIDKMYCTLTKEKTLTGKKAEGYFHSVYEMKDPYSVIPPDLGYQSWTLTIRGEPQKTRQSYDKYSLYIYLRGAKESKPTYISGLSVGSFSRAQYAASSKVAPSKEELLGVDTMVDYSALLSATSSCTSEVIMVNAALSNQNDAWYNRQIKGKADRSAPADKPAAYIGVSRTTDPKKAITAVMLYQTDAYITAAEMTINGVAYKCESTKSPIEMNGKNYFLYYTYNTGAIPGKPIEDIAIDNMPLISGCATNLSYDKNHTEVFGDADQANFIHLKYSKNINDYYNKLYIGKGINKRAALCDLLSQGCTDFIDIDLNEGIYGSSIYLGYRSKEIDYSKVNAKTTESAKAAAYADQTKEAVYDIILTKGEEFKADGFVSEAGLYYYPVSNVDLNDGHGDLLYMYYSCPYYSSRYNSSHDDQTLLPQNVYSGFYKKLGFARYDRVPYNSSLEGDEGSQNSVRKWEYIMVCDSARPANFNSGAVSYNKQDYYAGDIRITMFGQRNDGSIKPSGAITGGYLADTTAIGSMVYDYKNK